MKLCKCNKCGKKHFELTNKSKLNNRKLKSTSCRCSKCGCIHVKKQHEKTIEKRPLRRLIRDETLDERGCKCQKCKKLFARKNLIVHHKNKNRKDNRKKNLQVLCISCHEKKHPEMYLQKLEVSKMKFANSNAYNADAKVNMCVCRKCGKRHFKLTNKRKLATTNQNLKSVGFVSCKCPDCGCVHCKKLR